MDTNKKTMNVLVVDDEAPVCASVEKILKRKGHTVDQALSVDKALGQLNSGKRFDLVIADLMMPQAGGVELLKAMKENNCDVPVLIITGYASISSAVEATRHGASGYLPKPFTPDELERAVNGVVVKGPWKATQGAELPAEGIIDVDMPFDAKEVAQVTSKKFVEHLTRSDMPVVEAKPKAAANFCDLGQRACKKFEKSGMCKNECPLVAAERKKMAKSAALTTFVSDPIDVDMPFSFREISNATSPAYAMALGRSDMPVAGRWAEAVSAANSGRILIVDDEVVVANSLRKTFSRKGFTVEEAFSCKEAMGKVSEKSYDMVLLDMRMPDGNGLDLLPKIKALRPNMPVVIVTGFASIDTAVEAVHKGATDYMPKPFTPEEVYAVTSRVLKTAVA